jgi:uncharacterized protein YodC (DUF2158 family)
MINAGDVVKLKSGGERMSVGKIVKYSQSNETNAHCFWFVEGDLKHHEIAVDALIVVPAEDDKAKPGA